MPSLDAGERGLVLLQPDMPDFMDSLRSGLEGRGGEGRENKLDGM